MTRHGRPVQKGRRRRGLAFSVRFRTPASASCVDRGAFAAIALSATVEEIAPAARAVSSTATYRIDHVADGDTVDLRNGARVRLVQIDTPEVYFGTECYGPQASAITKRLLPPGTAVRLLAEPATDRVDEYGRLLRYVDPRAGRTRREPAARRRRARPRRTSTTAGEGCTRAGSSSSRSTRAPSTSACGAPARGHGSTRIAASPPARGRRPQASAEPTSASRPEGR